MLTYSAVTVAGFALLIWGADRFVIGAAATARNLGVPTLLIGLTVVALATSAPEILVSITAALNDNTQLAVGNAVGSNIANIGLVLGVTALVSPMEVRSTILRREMPALLAVTLMTVTLFMDSYLGRIDGILLIGGMILVLRWLVMLGISSKGADPLQQEIAAELPDSMTMATATGWLVLGLIVLLAGAKLLVWGATHLAEALEVSNLVIGLTVVAIGTSLPELAVSVVSALKKEHDIALGTIIGSNMFNCLAVIGPAAVIYPAAFNPELLSLHFPVMIALTLAMFALTYNFTGSGRISRIEGGILLAVFCGYEGYIVHLQ